MTRPRAGVGLRATARLADVVLVMVPAWLLLAPLLLVVLPDARTTTLVTTLVAWAVVVGYETWFTTTTGQTIGKRALGLRVVLAGTDEVPPTGPALTRAAMPPLFGVATFGLGWVVPYLWALLDPDRRGLHDKFAGTEVVRVLED